VKWIARPVASQTAQCVASVGDRLKVGHLKPEWWYRGLRATRVEFEYDLGLQSAGPNHSSHGTMTASVSGLI